MVTHGEMRRRAAQQRRRRMARRACGHCGGPAEVMLDWGGQRIPICRVCEGRLNDLLPEWPALRPQAGIRCAIDTPRPCDECWSREERGRRGVLDFLWRRTGGPGDAGGPRS